MPGCAFMITHWWQRCCCPGLLRTQRIPGSAASPVFAVGGGWVHHCPHPLVSLSSVPKVSSYTGMWGCLCVTAPWSNSTTLGMTKKSLKNLVVGNRRIKYWSKEKNKLKIYASDRDAAEQTRSLLLGIAHFSAVKLHLKGQSEALLSSSLFYYVLFTFSCGSFYEKCTPSSN